MASETPPKHHAHSHVPTYLDPLELVAEIPALHLLEGQKLRLVATVQMTVLSALCTCTGPLTGSASGTSGERAANLPWVPQLVATSARRMGPVVLGEVSSGTLGDDSYWEIHLNGECCLAAGPPGE